MITATSGLTANGALTANNVFTLGDNGDLGSVNTSSWNISTAGVASGFTGLSSSGTINFSGLTASSAVYTDASKNLTSTAPTSGTLGYWARIAGNLSPATSSDTISATSSASTVATFTSTGASNFALLVEDQASDTTPFVIDASGNVGIGTTAPAVNLHIYQSSPTADQTLFGIGTSDDTSRFTVDEDGDVSADGIISAGNYFQRGNIVINSGGTTTFSNANFSLEAGGTGDVLINLDSDTDLNVESGALFVRGSDNNVGIGTTGPEEELTVIGDIQLGITDGTRYVYFDDGDASSNPGIRFETTTDKMQFSHDGTTWGDIGSGGSGTSWWAEALGVLSPVNETVDLAIGGTATASATFYVSAATGDLTLANSETLSNANDSELAFSDGTNTLTIDLDEDTATAIDFTTNGSVDLTFNPGGNVGIGTTSPSQELDLIGDLELENTTSDDTGVIYKGANRFIHNFQDPTGGGAIPLGYNTFVGVNAGNFTMGSTATATYHASYNTAIGYNSFLSNTIGYQNTAMGYYSLYANTDGNTNTAFGTSSLRTNSTGDSNTAMGYYSLYANTDGNHNIAIGHDSLKTNSTGDYNVAIGNSSLSLSTGNGSTATGYKSLATSSSGGKNTATGYYSLFNVTLGHDNTAMGYNTGLGITTGNYNTILGANVTGLSASLSNTIIIADGAGNQRIYIDNLGNVGIGTTSPTSKLHVATNTTTLTGKAALIVDQLEDQDILTASASGSTKMVLTNSGTLKLFNASSTISNTSGDITINAASDNISFSGDNLINVGQIDASDQVRVGNLTSNPTAIGEGSIYYNTTDDKLYYYTASGWTEVGSGGGSGTSWWDETLGVLHPVNETLDLVVGATATASAEFHVNASTGNITTTGDLAVNGGDITTTATTFNIDVGDTGTINFRDGTNTLVAISDQGTTGRLAVSGSLQVGSTSTVVYSRFGTATTTRLTAAQDVLISGKFEVDQAIFVNTGLYSGDTGTLVFSFASDNATLEGNLTLTAGGTIQSTGNSTINIDAGTGRVQIGGGSGKLDVGTIDPVYTINGDRYATYMAGMIGIKEETTGTVETSQYIPGVGYKQTIDFTTLEKGSDLWLFSKTTDLAKHIDKMVVLLSASGNNRSWYEIDAVNYKLHIFTSRPTSVSFRLTAPRFDVEQWTNYSDSSSTGFVLDDNPFIIDEDGNITEMDYLAEAEIIVDENQNYNVKLNTGEIIETIDALAKLVVGNIKAGAVEAQEIATDSFYAFQGTIDNLLITGGLVTPVIQTETISPLADSDIIIDLENTSPDSTESSFGKLLIEGVDDEVVASIDAEGNATFSGTVAADEVKTDELHAGKIYADEIIARNGSFGEISSETSSSITLEEIEELLRAAEEDQEILVDAANSNIFTATESATLEELAISDLYVTNQAAINALSVTASLSIGTDFIVQSSQTDENIQVNSIDTLTAPLKLQSLALASVEIMAGLVKIDTNGNVEIAGDLYIAGRIESSGLTLKAKPEEENQDKDFGKLLSLQGLGGNEVASIDASGAAQFATLKAGKLIIAGSQATTSATFTGLVIETNATAGTAKIPAGSREVIIENPNVTDYTLIYVTPLSSTKNHVLYIKKKESCSLSSYTCQPYFVAGFDEALTSSVEFNWWIIDVTSP